MKYQVVLSFTAQKWVADGSGHEVSESLKDLIEFAVFDVNGEELCKRRQWVNDDSNEISMIVDRLPARAGIDPHYLLIDKRMDNNIIAIGMN